MTGAGRRAAPRGAAILLAFLALAGLGLGTPPVRAEAGGGQPAGLQIATAGFQAFRMVDVDQGWLLVDNQLFWTADRGTSWSNITPSLASQASLASVFFLDRWNGWAVLVAGGETDPLFFIARTQDGGASWASQPLALFASGDPDAAAEAVFQEWVDSRTGWLVVRRAAGSNFSIGSLFRTLDGGETWARLAMPIGEPVTFVSAQQGWTAGGAAGDEFYRTLDGGLSWQPYSVGEAGGGGLRSVYLLPEFDDPYGGQLPVMVTDGNYARVDFYQTDNGGTSWRLASSATLDGNVDLSIRPPLALLPGRGYILVVPHSDRIVSLTAGLQETRYNRDTRSASVTDLAMASGEIGWALSMTGDCNLEPGPETVTDDTPKSEITCLLRKRLLRTTDGGLTWEVLRLPSGATAGLPEGSRLSLAGGINLLGYPSAGALTTSTLLGQAFDKCEISTLSQMAQWWRDSPYAAVNLYIGGSARACANTLLNASFVAQLYQQGWRFIPTWVGPQAPCTTFRSRFSYDLATAYNQGVAEANAAITVATSLGFTDASQRGTVIYYDLEGYNTANATCRSAVRSFMSGWTDRMAARGNLSGVYGSVCASALTDFASLAKPADVIWPAWWTYSTYNPRASIWGSSCMADSFWPNHQRIRQYAGAHTETWGGIAFNIDSNVMDGLLAVPYQPDSGILVPSEPSNPKPVDHSLLARTTDVWLYWNTDGATCGLHLWGGRTDLSQTGNCSSLYLGQLRGGSYSWQVTANNAHGSTIGPVWTFDVQPYPPSGLVVTSTASTGLTLGWTLSPDEPLDVDQYDVYINGVNVAALPAGSSSATVSGLACNTSFSITLRARRQNVQSVNSNTVSATTGACGAASWTPTFTPTQATGTATATPTATFTPTATRTPTDTPAGAFGKLSPSNGASGLSPSLILSWVASPGAGSYNVCYDTANNGVCDTYWTNLASTSLGIGGLDPARTYYWQVVAIDPPGVIPADGGVWWSFQPNGAAVTPSRTPSPTPSSTPSATSTSGAASPTFTPTATRTPTPTRTATATAASIAFGKIAPLNGQGGLPASLALSWSPSAGASAYLFCLDQYNNGLCDTSWSMVYATGANVSGLLPGRRYYWQVQAINSPSSVFADGGLWWTFDTAAGASTSSPTATPTLPGAPSATSTTTPTASATATATPTPTLGPPPATATSSPTTSGGGVSPFAKQLPADDGTGLPASLVLSWGVSSGATSYIYCYDRIDNNQCDTRWLASLPTSVPVSGLVPGAVYHWQVIAVNPPIALPADDGRWWSFTVGP